MSASPGSGGTMPAAGHTDENGNFHWGSAAARAERIARDQRASELLEAAKAIQERPAKERGREMD